jgi:hypothetical protein
MLVAYKCFYVATDKLPLPSPYGENCISLVPGTWYCSVTINRAYHTFCRQTAITPKKLLVSLLYLDFELSKALEDLKRRYL